MKLAFMLSGRLIKKISSKPVLDLGLCKLMPNIKSSTKTNRQSRRLPLDDTHNYKRVRGVNLTVAHRHSSTNK